MCLFPIFVETRLLRQAQQPLASLLYRKFNFNAFALKYYSTFAA